MQTQLKTGWSLLQAENELASLSKKLQTLEEDLEKCEEKTKAAQMKFEQVSQTGDESER